MRPVSFGCIGTAPSGVPARSNTQTLVVDSDDNSINDNSFDDDPIKLSALL